MNLSRSLLLATLALSIAACGDKEETPAAAPETPAADARPAMPERLGERNTEPPAAAMQPGYERALANFRAATSYSFELELSSGGLSQFASGERSGTQTRFDLRVVPANSAGLDGKWFSNGTSFFKEQAGQYLPSMQTVEIVEVLNGAISALPAKEDGLSPDRPPIENVQGTACQPMLVNLATNALLSQAFKQFQVCIDEAASQLVQIKATYAGDGGGYRIDFKNFGSGVVMPKVEAKQWWEEYQRAQ